MPQVKGLLRVAVRVYALWGALCVALFLPVTVGRIGTTREAPVRFASIPRADGTLAGSPAGGTALVPWTEVSIDGGPRVPAGGIVACREMPYLPAGTPLEYRAADGSVLRGAVEERPATAARVAAAAASLLIAVGLCAAGAALGVSGVSRPALMAGAALAGLGHFAASGLLEPNASLVTDPAARNALVLAWVAFPRHFAFFWLAGFLSVFPTDVTARPSSRVFRALLAGLALLQALFVPLFQVPGVLERLSVPTQALLVGGVRHVTRAVFAAGLVAAAVLVASQVRGFRGGALPSGTRRRAELVGIGLLAGFAPPLLFSLVQILSVVLRGRPLLPNVAMSLSFLPMLLVPAVLAYAMLSPRVLSVGILVRKAVFLAFAERTVRLASFVPMAALGLVFYRNRESPLGGILAGHPVLAACAVAATFVGLRYGDRTRPFLARLFFRARGASPRALARLSEELRQARDLPDLADHLSAGVERVLGVEQAALFVRSDESGGYSSPGRALPSLEATSRVVEEAESRGESFRIDADEGDALWRELGELERNWLESTRTQLVVPLKGSAGRLLAVLAVGEKISELPLDPEEEHFLSAVASSGALALENLLLRSTHPSSTGTSRPRGEPPSAAGDAAESALSCRRCTRVLPPGSGGTCPDDETPLEPAPVPHLLAGKYRFERRLGAGGMGVVYLARDLALARDVAIKTLPSLSTGSARRLQREARAAALLVHPNLGLIFSAESWHGTPMLVLEYLAGGTLSTRIRRGPVPLSSAVAWGAALAAGLEAIHARGVLHRDIKPSNVGFAVDGTPKLLDFGLVRLLDDDARPAPAAEASEGPLEEAPASLTSSSRVVGTVPYLSPEALQGRPPSAAFDLWGLSLTIYETVTGVNPFVASSAARTADRILSRPAPDPRSLRPGCPAPLADLLLSALARSAAERPASARALREAFEAVGRAVPPGDDEGGPSQRPRVPTDVELLRTPTIEP
jgi:serine/threonine protein kinase